MKSADSYQEALLHICTSVVTGEVTPQDAADKLKEMQASAKDTCSVLIDVLQTVDVDVDCSDNEEEKKRFDEFCKLCSEFIPGDVLQVALDSKIEEAVNSKIIKTKTRLFYKQLKFNLLREESEGYAKIITELSQDEGPDFNAQIALSRVRCLIGQFNLDPNRVLDLILECFECRLSQHKFFLELLKRYGASKDDICNLMGFKFTFYQARYKSRGDVPGSLYVLAAILIHFKVIDLVPLCLFLTPNTDFVLDHHKKLMEEAVARAKKMQIRDEIIHKYKLI